MFSKYSSATSKDLSAFSVPVYYTQFTLAVECHNMQYIMFNVSGNVDRNVLTLVLKNIICNGVTKLSTN